MKTIDTLVPDIYKLFDDDTTIVENEKVQALGVRIAQHLKGQLTRTQEGARLRMSNFGKKCKRQLWYGINKPELAEKLPAPAKIKYFFGHLIEEVVLWLAELAGHKVEGMQDEVDLHGLKGRRDGLIDGVLVDVKSASSYSFSKFVDHLSPNNDNFGYLDQLDGYLTASQEDGKLVEKDKAAFLVVDKQLGKIHLDKHPKQNVDYGTKIKEIQQIISSPQPPIRYFDDQPEGKSGNRRLGVECSYCEFKHSCWGNLRVYNYSTGPKYFTKHFIRYIPV